MLVLQLRGRFSSFPWAEFRRQIEVNLVSVLTVTQAFFPLLRKASDHRGRPARIVNISSVAGRLALPFMGPYVASKHGVEGLSGSLRWECMLYVVDVVVIDPATVATPIWDKAEKMDLSVVFELAIPGAQETNKKIDDCRWATWHFSRLDTRLEKGKIFLDCHSSGRSSPF
jgi:hypothetical protein